MARKIDKSKDNYRYSGDPKSYWFFVEKKAKAFIGNGKQDPEKRTKDLNRLKQIDEKFKEIRKTKLGSMNLPANFFDLTHCSPIHLKKLCHTVGSGESSCNSRHSLS